MADSSAETWPRRSWLLAGIFGVILILTGIGGFVLPPGPMSNATPYNGFHIAFGVLGVALAASKNRRAVAYFNVGFGAIDLWQAVAGVTGLFPFKLFALKTGDHVAHVVIGLILVIVGALALRAMPKNG